MPTKLIIGKFKARLPEPLALVEKEQSVVVSYGRGKRPVAVFGPAPVAPKRKLSLLEGKATMRIASDWKITEEELLGL